MRFALFYRHLLQGLKAYKAVFIAALILIFIHLENIHSSIKIWVMPNGINPKESLDNLINDYSKSINEKISVEVIDWGIAYKKISEALVDKDPPHILQLGSTWTPYFADKGYLTDLSGYDEYFNFKRFNVNGLDSCKISGKPEIYAIPWFLDIRQLYFNKKYADKLRLDINDLNTYSGFKKYLYKIKNSDIYIGNKKVEPYAFPGRNDWNVIHNFSPWIWTEGGDFVINKNGKWQSNLLSENTIRGIIKFISFSLDEVNAKNALDENSVIVQERFLQGEYAVVTLLTDFLINKNQKGSIGGSESSIIYKDDFFIHNYPGGTFEASPFIGGSNLCIPKKYANDAKVLNLLKFLSGRSSINDYSKTSGFIPADTGLWDEWEKLPYYDKIIESAARGKSYPNIPKWGDIEAELVNSLGDIWTLVDSNFFTYESLYKILYEMNGNINKILEFNETESYLSLKDFTGFSQNYENFLKTEIKESNNYLLPILVIIIIISIAAAVILLRGKIKKYGKNS